MPAADTIAAPATPAGESALALVRVSGPLAGALAAGALGATPPPRLATHGDYRDRDGAVVDDVVATFYAGPHSYTGEDTLELSTHGSPFIVQRVLEDCLARGCRAAEPGEFTKRAFLNGRMDLSQAEAVMDLIHARSARALEAANRQLRGALGQRITGMTDRLVDVTATVEAYLDFPEEDLPPEDRARLGAGLRALRDDLGRLLATGRYGELLRSGVRTVLAGAPNAGKSSLLNRLLGWERALVSPEPGTTRDFLEEARIVGPHCIRFVDTAGMHASPGPLEERGIARALERAAAADLVLVVMDTTGPTPTPPPALAALLHPDRSIIVWNKADLAPPPPTPPSWVGWRSVAVSALTGLGLDLLERAIVETIEQQRLENIGDWVVINARHSAALDEARQAIESALQKVEAGAADELLAADLRAALDALGRIGGRVDHERILDRLFASFCIGK